MCYELEAMRLHDVQSGQLYTLEMFNAAQEAQKIKATEHLVSFSAETADTVKVACETALALLEERLVGQRGGTSVEHEEEALNAGRKGGNRMAAMMKTSRASRRQTGLADEDEGAKFSYAITAARRSEQRRLLNFIRLADYMVSDALHILVVESVGDMLAITQRDMNILPPSHMVVPADSEDADQVKHHGDDKPPVFEVDITLTEDMLTLEFAPDVVGFDAGVESAVDGYICRRRRFAFSVNAQAGDVKAMPDLMVRACEPVMGVRLGLDRVAAKLLEEKGLKEKDVRVMPSRAHEACFVEYKDKGLKTVVVRGIVRAHVDMQVREIVEDIVKPLLEEIDDGSVDTSHVCLKVLGGSEGLNAKALAHDVEVAVAQSLVPSLLLHRVGCVGVTLEIGDTVCVDVATPSGFRVAQVSVVDELPSPFPSLETADVRRRAAARKAGGFLISDAVELLQLASDGCDVTDVEEFVLSEEGSLVPVSSPQAHKEAVGMRVYSLKLNGCSVLIVGNDLTHRVASMGVKECKTFVAACERAEKMQTPLLFLNASSGARLGVDEAMKKMLTFAEDGKLVAGGMEVSSVSNPNADYGVPSLSGCGATARAYSRLYDKGFCVTICIGRAVGIGAYLARLGRRTIQVAQTPIILTGQAALNKVLGKDVYESNAQLGGPQIMHQNGVTHLTASNCLEAMRQACCRCDRYPDGYDGACGTRRSR
ncbi:acetyl-CoA carboxylase [Pseudoscourfieldia marina]